MAACRELHKMLDAVSRFPKGSAPKLREGEREYTIEEDKDGIKYICYTDPASRVPTKSIRYGYVTAFTYLYCKEESGKVVEQDVRARVKLQPYCGTLSYSEIPNFYKYCLGMTGTLDCEQTLFCQDTLSSSSEHF